MRRLVNLLLVAGDGRNSGKTTLVCRLIRQFCVQGIVSIKISPHFHEPSGGLMPVLLKNGYSIFEETNRDGIKDSSRMLESGASKVFYIQVAEGFLNESFNEVMQLIPAGSPVICESPSLINHVDPGVFIIMINEDAPNRKDISKMSHSPHYEYSLTELNKTEVLPYLFIEGAWKYMG